MSLGGKLVTGLVAMSLVACYPPWPCHASDPELRPAKRPSRVLAKPARPPRIEKRLPLPAPSPASRPSADAVSLAHARGAFQVGRFAEPPGENAIELARLSLRANPACTECKVLEAEASTAYEKQALEAVGRRDVRRAAVIYDRLFALFPDRRFYQDKARELAIPPIAGIWNVRYTMLISTSFRVEFRTDGTCYCGSGSYGEDGPQSGRWECVDPGRRMFVVTWSEGVVENLTLSEDALRLHGTTTNGRSVDGRRIRS